MIHVTSRVLRLIRAAEMIVQSSDRSVITPWDLFVGGLYERTGVLGELFLRGRFDLVMLRDATLQADFQGDAMFIPPFELAISQDAFIAIQEADQIRRTYKQVVINEGHLFTALVKHSEVVPLLRFSQSRITVSEIESIVCSPRDMIVHLAGFNVGDARIGDVSIRRAKSTERDVLIHFVRTEFGDRWLDSVKNGFGQDVIPIFVAVDDGFQGFACFDVVRSKRGVFGPMGTRFDCREKGVGRALLHRCLSEMQHIGYDYAVINNAGPIEFYEKACGAVVIPLFP